MTGRTTTAGAVEGLAAEMSRKIARVHPSHHASAIPVTIKISRTYAEMENLVTALQAHSLPGDVGMREALERVVDWQAERGADDQILPADAQETWIADAMRALSADTRKFRATETVAALTPSALSGDAGEGADCEGLGDALGVLSHKLRMSGFLATEDGHTAYEKVVAEFQALSSKKGARHG